MHGQFAEPREQMPGPRTAVRWHKQLMCAMQH